jgi:hypothetical protein
MFFLPFNLHRTALECQLVISLKCRIPANLLHLLQDELLCLVSQILERDKIQSARIS